MFTMLLLSLFAGDECKTYCQDTFAAVAALDTEVQELAQMIAMKAKSEEDMNQLNETYPMYVDAQKTLSAAKFVFDFTEVFESADVKVEGFTYENAAKIATVGMTKLDVLKVTLEALKKK